jgi:mannose-6-phosphate isomerase-like protein (cupin superfamily)
MKAKIILIAWFAALAVPALAQSNNSAQVFFSKNVQTQLAQAAQQAKTSGSGGTTLGDYGTHSIRISTRSKSGGAEVHGHFDDIMIVQKGTATLITGGKLVNPQTHDNGEITGTGIVAGQVQTISAGDIIHVPAGTPHQIMIRDGSDYRAIVIKVKE